jgi:arabinofuranosyltransferase
MHVGSALPNLALRGQGRRLRPAPAARPAGGTSGAVLGRASHAEGLISDTRRAHLPEFAAERPVQYSRQGMGDVGQDEGATEAGGSGTQTVQDEHQASPMGGDGAVGRRPRVTERRSLLELVGMFLPVVLLVWKAWERRWMSDDGMINLRVVDQLLAGHGPVFNAGERVEAATSPLWIAILALGDIATPLRLEWIAVTVGIALSVTGVAAAIAGSARLWQQAMDGGALVPIGALCLVALSPVWDFSSSGLEGGLSFCWLGLSLLALQRWSNDDRGGLVAAIVVGLGPVIRPDFVVITVILLSVVVVGERGASVARRVRIVGVGVAIPVLYEVFRVVYFGAVVPNTYFAKEGGDSNWAQGWVYLRDFVGPYRLWIPVVCLALTAVFPLILLLRRRSATRAALVAAAFPLSGFVSAFAIVRGGGDFMHARLLLPSLFAIVAPVATVAIRRNTAPALAALPWAFVCLVALEPPRFSPDQLDGINDHRSGLHTMLGKQHLVTLHDFGLAPGGINYFELDDDHRLYFGQTPLEIDGRPVPLVQDAPNQIVLAYGVGAISYFAGPDTYVLDMLGLGDALTARLELDARGSLPGHEKALPAAWVWARYIDPSVEPDPTLFDAPDILLEVSPTLAARQQGEFATEVDAARAVMRCPDIDRLTDSIQRPLGPGQMVDAVSGALTTFSLRVPPNPAEAQRQLC